MSSTRQEAPAKTYPFPVWGTQGGGLVKQEGNIYIFVEEPDCPGLKVGDKMPDEWGIAPANPRARDVLASEQYEEGCDY